MFKQFVVVIPNVLTIVNKIREILKTHVEAVHRDGAYKCGNRGGIINVMSVILQQ